MFCHRHHDRDDDHIHLYWHIGPVNANRHTRRRPHPPGRHHRKVRADMGFSLKDNENVNLSVTGKDAAGNDAPLTGKPVYSVDDPSILALVDNGDGTANVKSLGKLGTATVTVVDAESNGQSFQGSLAVDVLGGDVVSIDVQPGTPVTNA